MGGEGWEGREESGRVGQERGTGERREREGGRGERREGWNKKTFKLLITNAWQDILSAATF